MLCQVCDRISRGSVVTPCSWPSSHRVSAQKFVSISGESSQPLTVSVGLQGYCHHSSTQCMNLNLDRQTQPSRWGLEAAGSTVCFLRTIWCYLHPLNRAFNMHVIEFQGVSDQERKLTLKRPTSFVSPETKSVYVTSGNALQQVKKLKHLGITFTTDRR